MPGEVIVSMDYRGELPCLIGCICLILNVENTRVMTHTLMGFYHYESLWDGSSGNASNGSCRKTSHISLILNTGGSNGYIN